MVIRIICVGNLKESYLKDGVDDYLRRINKYHRTEILIIKSSNKEDESKCILRNIKKNEYVVGLCIDGTNINSLEFSKMIDNELMVQGNVTFLIGGSCGFDENVLGVIDKKISFSKMTFPHGLFRIILLEQIYRGFKIINNEEYHK
ncbi:MAG: 23S rRNA (pseudouridine(1915)-N(3))-methyltransferase RlmH [Bacilli bacterium]